MLKSFEETMAQALARVQKHAQQSKDMPSQRKICLKILNELVKEQVQNARTHNPTR